jgi:mono/diheme cytochrome c family protein
LAVAPTAASDDAPLSPADEARTFALAEPSLRVALAAAEPLVEAPVCATFDEDGRLWVVEMRTYMLDPLATDERAPKNRIRVLDDLDGDGVFDRATTFLDGLVLPRAVAPCFGGALVVEPPKLYFCKDADGDGAADARTPLLDGFGGLDAPEHAANGLLYGLDNVYELSQHGVRIRFDGVRATTEPASSAGQWGLTKDEQGRLYYTPNSNALLFDFFSKRYGGRNPQQGRVAGLGEGVARDHRTWPLRATPVNRGYQPKVLGPDGRLASLTAACSPLWWADDGFGADFRGSVFLCEPGGNLVKRLTTTERAGFPSAAQAYEGREFLASTDARFRPVHLTTTPDGALLVVDMYRGLIQHKLYLTPYLRGLTEERNLLPPLEAGRLWRVARADAPRRAPRKLSAASHADLAALLGSPDLHLRERAQRLLVERRAADVAPALRELVRRPPVPAAVLHALWTLDGVGALDDADVLAALAHPRAPVRVAGLRFAEERLDRPAVLAAAAALTVDDDRRVRVQAVLALGARAAPPESFGRLRAAALREGDDAVLRAAALSGLRGRETPTLLQLSEIRRGEAKGGPPSLTPEARVFASDVADAALRGGPASAVALYDAAARLLADDRPLADVVLGRVAARQKLDEPTPRPLDLDVEPRALTTAVAALPADAKRARLERVLAWTDWPQRPPASRPAAARPLTSEEKVRFERGGELFGRCTPCHGRDGDGVGGMGPSLAASKRVDGPSRLLALPLLHGMEGTFALGTATYAGSMPKADLKDDDEIAAVLTYLRRSFGHVQPPVDAADVARVRAEFKDRSRPWTVSELDSLSAR